MIIGAQLYSVAALCRDMEGVEKTLRDIKNIGFDSVQLSGFAYDPSRVAQIADEIGLHIGLTHTAITDIINDTDAVIEKHRILGADTVGIGAPVGYFDMKDGTPDFRIHQLISDLSPAVARIKDAGLNFGYHNHFMELLDLGGYTAFDVLFDKTDWNFTLDTGWVDFTGADTVALINKYADRLRYVHLKDFRAPLPGEGDTDIDRTNRIVPLFRGAIPVDRILTALREVGTVNVAYVEQDNASLTDDPIAQMQMSYDALSARGWIE